MTSSRSRAATASAVGLLTVRSPNGVTVWFEGANEADGAAD